jgi:hypothetical protein
MVLVYFSASAMVHPGVNLKDNQSGFFFAARNIALRNAGAFNNID